MVEKSFYSYWEKEFIYGLYLGVKREIYANIGIKLEKFNFNSCI